MAWPELIQLIHNKIRVLFKNPVPTFLDDTLFRTAGNRLGRIDAMIAEGSAATPAKMASDPGRWL
jgi:hypothetical protein